MNPGRPREDSHRKNSSSYLKQDIQSAAGEPVSHKYLDYYLDEFTFRFNRRRSKSRGKLFFRLAQQAVAVDPVTYYGIVHPRSGSLHKSHLSLRVGWMREFCGCRSQTAN